MIKVEPCKGCGGVILVDDFMGVRVRCDVTAVDAHEATQAVLASVPLYRVVYEGGRPHSFASASMPVLRALGAGRSPGLTVVAAHRCSNTKEAPAAPLTALQGVGGTPAPKAPSEPVSSPSVAPGTPSSAPTVPSSATATTAAPSRSEIPPTFVDGDSIRGPRCSGCGQACKDGTYGAIHLGELLVWAHHVDNCT